MLEYNDFSHYQAENILQTTSNPAHSGPELCYAMPDSLLADRLAHEVVMDKISIVPSERISWTTGGSVSGLRLGLK